MKKGLFFSVLLATTAVNAQFMDDIEAYPVGPVNTAHWGSWASTNPLTDAYVSDLRSVSGDKSIFIGNTGDQDAVLDLGNKASGTWSISWDMYIPTDSAAYYNFQEVTPVVNGVFATNFFFGVSGTTTPGNCSISDDAGTAVGSFTYPQGEWFKLDHIIDCDGDAMRVLLNGAEVYAGAFYGGGNLGGIDFYSINSDNSYYMDDFEYIGGAVSVEESSSIELNVYPNPMTDVVNISSAEIITNVAVFDMLGKQVKTIATSDSNVILNTSDLPNGTYILKVTAGTNEEIMRIVK